MSHHKVDRKPDGADHTYRGWEVTDHGVHNNDINEGQQEPELDEDEE